MRLWLTLIFCGWFLAGCQTADPAREASDIAAVQSAFATLQEYQKTDDRRALDFFMRNGSVSITTIEGAAKTTVVIRADKFRELLQEEMAKPEGSQFTYEDVQYAGEGGDVRVTGAIHYTGSGKRGPFAAWFRSHGKGVWKIQQLQITVFKGARRVEGMRNGSSVFGK